MLIDEVGASDLINRSEKVKKSNQSKVDAIKSVSGDKLEISKTSGFQMAIKEALGNTPEIREDKVKEITEKIDKGTYSPSSSNIAKKIMESDEYNGIRLELFG